MNICIDLGQFRNMCLLYVLIASQFSYCGNYASSDVLQNLALKSSSALGSHDSPKISAAGGLVKKNSCFPTMLPGLSNKCRIAPFAVPHMSRETGIFSSNACAGDPGSP